MGAAVLAHSSFTFAGAGLDWSDVSQGIGGWHLSFDILIVLVLAVFSRGRFSGCRRAFRIYHSTRLDAIAGSVLTFLEIIWESCTLSILMIL